MTVFPHVLHEPVKEDDWLTEVFQVPLERQFAEIVLYYEIADPTDLTLQLARLVARSGATKLVLKGDWPEYNYLNAFKVEHPNVDVILHVTHEALEAVAWDREFFTGLLLRYGNVLSGIELELDARTGMSVEAEKLVGFVESLRDSGMQHIGVLGCFTPENLERLHPLLSACSYLSIIHTGGFLIENGDMDVERLDSYVNAVFALLYP